MRSARLRGPPQIHPRNDPWPASISLALPHSPDPNASMPVATDVHHQAQLAHRVHQVSEHGYMEAVRKTGPAASKCPVRKPPAGRTECERNVRARRHGRHQRTGQGIRMELRKPPAVQRAGIRAVQHIFCMYGYLHGPGRNSPQHVDLTTDRESHQRRQHARDQLGLQHI